MGKRLNISEGTKFGLLTVIGEGQKITLPSGQTNRMIKCVCDCGKISEIRLLHLVRSRITNCGCNKAERGDAGTPLHNIWRGMINRATNPNHINANRYFERGITFFDKWKKFREFKKWAECNGFVEGLQIDRIDNDKGYYPDNCRFVTNVVNANNKSNNKIVNYNGVDMPVMLLIRQLNLLDKAKLIKSRIRHGWDINDAISNPVRIGNYRRSTK